MRTKFLSQVPGVQNDSLGHLPALDVLRGLAATWVVLFHLVYLTTPNLAPPALIDKLIKSGGIGVTLFFVVSAFSLCLSSERHGGEGTWPFYLRRLFRIAPLFYVILLVSLLRDQLAFGVQHSYMEIVASALFLFNFVALWLVGGSIVAYACITYFADGPQFWQWSFFKHLPSFLLGMLVFEVFAALRSDPTFGVAVGRVALAAGVLLALALFYSEQQFPLMAPLYWQAILCALILLGSTLGAAQRFFSLPPLRWLGRNSYSIYLVHPLIIVALQPTIKNIATGNQSEPLVFLISAALTLACTFIVSELCWYLVEQPGMRLGARLIRSLKFALQPHDGNTKATTKPLGVTNV